MKKIIGLFFVLTSTLIFGQQETELKVEEKKKIYIKGNALTALVLMPNVGIEYQLASKYTLQGDVFISPWKSISGNHAQVYMGHIEGRYYFKEAFKGWYVGGNAGFGVYDISKWNYLDSGKYQRGFNYMLGAVVGYQYQWKERWNLDFYIGGGTSQGFYHGYERNKEGVLERYEDASWFNKSGEWIPYRGGVMISYRLR